MGVGAIARGAAERSLPVRARPLISCLFRASTAADVRTALAGPVGDRKWG